MAWSQRTWAHWPRSHPWGENRAVSEEGVVLGSPAVPGARPRPESQCRRVTTPLPHPGRDSLAGWSCCQRERPGGKSQGCAAPLPCGGHGVCGDGTPDSCHFPRLCPRPSPCQPTDQRGPLGVRQDIHFGPLCISQWTQWVHESVLLIPQFLRHSVVDTLAARRCNRVLTPEALWTGHPRRLPRVPLPQSRKHQLLRQVSPRRQ